MVPAQKILDAARQQGVDIVGLSGLITPSLDEMVHVAREMQRQGLAMPLLVGGATTSRKHTALRIAPSYDHPTLHVADASRAPAVVARLLNPQLRKQLDAENRAEQQRMQQDHQSGQDQRELLPYAQARSGKAPIRWEASRLWAPEFTGVRRLVVPLTEIAPYIDWSPFFHVWELRGGYPKILGDPRFGPQARQLFADAGQLLEKLIAQNWLTAQAVYGFFPANSEGDDLVLYADQGRQRELARFATLRQQARKRDPGQPYYALADFIAPRQTGLADYLGAFAVTAGVGIEAHLARFEQDHDSYSAILLKALADRLAEALAELLHERARREWGYGKQENLTKEDLLRERYQGIRPAPGYPACPDHSQKRCLFDLLRVEQQTSMRLTETCAVLPAASVCGLYFAHPQSRYFSVGRIGRDQAQDYARRQGLSLAEAERWLAPNLGYEPGAVGAEAAGA
jgi:5-methyltetrahydrofolate--homocysteine methyltransferase